MNLSGVGRWLFQIRLRIWARVVLAVYWPVLAIITHWPRLHVGAVETAARENYINPDKVVHFGSFFVLTLLITYSRLFGRRLSDRANLIAAGLLAGAYAPLDEYTQAWFAERMPGVDDMLADLAGVASAVAAAPLLAALADCLRPTRKDEAPREGENFALPEASPRFAAGWTVWLGRAALAVGLGLVCVVFFLQGFENTKSLAEVRSLSVPRGWDRLRVDHLGHMLVAAVLAIALITARPAGVHRPRRSFLLAVALAAGAGWAIERLQGAAGQGYETGDIIAHTIGVGIGAAAWSIARLMVWAVQPWRRIPAPVPREKAGERSSPGEGSAKRSTVSQRSSTRTPAPDTDAPAEDHSRRFVGHAIVISALTLVSRLTGLVRDAVLAAAFGLGPIADAFFIGFLVPNLFRRLFGEGALTAAFVPAYTDLVHADRLTARRLASLCIAALLVVLGAITLIGEAVLAVMLARGQWSHDAALAIRLTMIMLPYMPLICITALLGGVLQVHGRFGAPAAAPVVLNLVLIIAAGAASVGWIGDGSDHSAVFIVSWAVVIAGVLQLLWQGAAVLRVEKFTAAIRNAARAAWPAFRGMMILMGPMVVGLAVFQINTFLDALIAFGLSPKNGADQGLQLFGLTFDYPIRPGGVAALQWSQRLYQFPLGVFGIAIATAIFPAMARAVAGATGSRDTDPTDKQSPDSEPGTRTALRDTLRQGLRLTMFIGLPASVGLILVRVPLSRVIYERGEFTLDDSMRVATILAGYASVIWAYSMTHVVTRAFYALKDARTPLLVSLAMMCVNLCLNLVLVWPLGAAGLAWSSAVCACGQVAMLLLAIRHYTGDPVGGEVWRAWGKTALLTAAMAAALAPFVIQSDAATSEWAGALESLVVLLIVGVAVYAGGAWALDAKELKWLLKRRVG